VEFPKLGPFSGSQLLVETLRERPSTQCKQAKGMLISIEFRIVRRSIVQNTEVALHSIKMLHGGYLVLLCWQSRRPHQRLEIPPKVVQGLSIHVLQRHWELLIIPPPSGSPVIKVLPAQVPMQLIIEDGRQDQPPGTVCQWPPRVHKALMQLTYRRGLVGARKDPIG